MPDVEFSAAQSAIHEAPFVTVQQHDKEFYLTKLSLRALVTLSYASVRGVNQEEGAVQRLLNPRRINSIKEFTIAGGHYPASIVLNWVNESEKILQSNGILSIPIVARSAQIIDGQHRVAGLREVYQDYPDTQLDVPVAIYTNLTTKECADIFLAINTEQKPVPRSLVFDLYGVADDSIVDQAAARARDIALELNEETDSPYFDRIKLPGSPRKRGGIALSTAVTAIKPLVEDKGDFEQRGIMELETQKRIIKNLFAALRARYGSQWDEPGNAFMYASGFSGAIDFLRMKLLSYGQAANKYTQQLFLDALPHLGDDLIQQDEVKGLGGKEAALKIMDRLNSHFSPVAAGQAGIEV